MTAAFDRHERAQWRGRAQAYARSFALLCARPAEHLLDAVAVGPGSAVLDAGAGTGTVARLAAARGATVTALDAEPTMAAVAATRTTGRDGSVRAIVGALPRLPVADAAFDAAAANFVLNHVAEPVAGLRELGRVVRPGGRVAITVWPSPAPVAQRLWGEIFGAAGVVAPGAAPRLEAPHDFERTPDGVAGLMLQAGFSGVHAVRLEWTHRVRAEDWWAGPAAGIGTAGWMLLAQPPETVMRVRAEFDRRMAPFRQADGLLALPTAAVVASAHRT